MKKASKLLLIFLAVAMLVGMFSMTAYAKAPQGRGEVCETAEEDFTVLLAQSIADAANSAIERLVAQAQNSRHPNIAKLVRQTNAISQSAIFLINMLGVDAECVYETYVIGGVEVEIDPIIIIKRGNIVNG